ncbi:MAG: CPBP family intramembrane metalloprotease [Cyclobacteriaceae bacterium]|nr:CPBP family intramembrane metalloprotease [Cyclobacteriaceae bacterium]
MLNIESNPLYANGKNPWILLLSLILITLGGVLLIGQVLAFITAIIMSGVGIEELQNILTDPTAYPEQRSMFLVLQGMASFGGFIIAPLIFYYTLVKGNLIKDFIDIPSNIITLLLMTIIMVFSFMIVNTVFIDWNANIKLPEALDGFEKWAGGLEESMKVLTEYLTEFDSGGYFILAIIVIAVIPGVGEELLFRGFIQNILKRIFKNDHIAIWVAAILFSAIHFQFYGFIPRMLLGALFGYLYVWTGNLLIPIVAHFLNNSISLFALYIYQKGLIDIDVESTEALPTVYIIIFSALFAIALIYFKTYLTKINEHKRLDHRL